MKRRAALQVFRTGDPVDRAYEAFIPRYPVIEALDAQIMLATGCPGLLLYGRRRMGKSTLLRNLHGFIDGSVVSVYVSMQDPGAFSSLASFISVIQESVHGAALAGAMPEAADGLDACTSDSVRRTIGSRPRTAACCWPSTSSR